MQLSLRESQRPRSINTPAAAELLRVTGPEFYSCLLWELCVLGRALSPLWASAAHPIKWGNWILSWAPDSSENHSQKLHWAVDGTASPGLGWERDGQLVSCGWDSDLGSLNFLFPRGNPGPPLPSLGQPSLRHLLAGGALWVREEPATMVLYLLPCCLPPRASCPSSR